MQVKHKTVEVQVPCCGICGDELKGKDTFGDPYRCSCGIWDYDFDAKCHKLKVAFKKDPKKSRQSQLF